MMILKIWICRWFGHKWKLKYAEIDGMGNTRRYYVCKRCGENDFEEISGEERF